MKKAVFFAIAIGLLLLVVAVSNSHAQSFFHKKMKKANKNMAMYECSAVKPRVTFYQELESAVMYKKKRSAYRRQNKILTSRRKK